MMAEHRARARALVGAVLLAGIALISIAIARRPPAEPDLRGFHHVEDRR